MQKLPNSQSEHITGLSKIISHYSPRFQRIIVKYREEQSTEHDAKAQTGCRTFKTQTP